MAAGVRTRISDDLLFLPYVTARYVYVTADQDILRAHAPFLRSAELSDAEHDRYETPEQTAETAPLMEHCLRAIARVRYGEHGIPLMQGGDWNDGMDRVGGESAWLGFFLIVVLREFAPLCEESVRRELDAQRIQLGGILRLVQRSQRLRADLFQLFFHKRMLLFVIIQKNKALRPDRGRKTRLPRYHPLFAENLRCFWPGNGGHAGAS